jgi:hypothetical protein
MRESDHGGVLILHDSVPVHKLQDAIAVIRGCGFG